MASRPGENYQYTSLNYDLLGCIIESVTEYPFYLFMQRQIFEPLKLYHTCCVRQLVQGSVQKRASGNKLLYGGHITTRQIKMSCGEASGYIYATIKDLARWMRIQLGEISIPDKLQWAVDKAHEPDRSVQMHDIFYYAGGLHSHCRLRRYYHEGNNPDSSAYVMIDLKAKRGICLLADINTVAVKNLADAAERICKGYDHREYEKDSLILKDAMHTKIAVFAGTAMCLLIACNNVWIYLPVLIITIWPCYQLGREIKEIWRTNAGFFLSLSWLPASAKISYLLYFCLFVLLLLRYIVYMA